jgi:hypothetical protein
MLNPLADLLSFIESFSSNLIRKLHDYYYYVKVFIGDIRSWIRLVENQGRIFEACRNLMVYDGDEYHLMP